jgi:hypothetical protein
VGALHYRNIRLFRVEDRDYNGVERREQAAKENFLWIT